MGPATAAGGNSSTELVARLEKVGSRVLRGVWKKGWRARWEPGMVSAYPQSVVAWRSWDCSCAGFCAEASLGRGSS
jgi:hypothetical protein